MIIGGQNLTSNITTYRWLADGTKAGVTDNDGNGFEYLGSFVYQRDVAGLNLESTSFGAGRFVASSTGEMTPFYHITDHLGSVRAVFTAEFKDVSLGRGTVRRLITELIAQNDYYPFGLKHENPNLAQHTSNRYLYNGKEEQTTGSIDLLDYGARMYDPTTARFGKPDRFAEKYVNISPYAYCANNPLIFVDLKGDSLTIAGNNAQEIINAISHGLVDKNVSMKFNNGVLDPASIQQNVQNTSDVFLQDLYEVAVSPTMVELYVSDKNTYMMNNEIITENFETPKDTNTSDYGIEYEKFLVSEGEPLGTSVVGNLGQTLVPSNTSKSGKRSTNNNIQMIINGTGSINHTTVGISHELGHVVLYLRNLPFSHGESGVDKFIYNRTDEMLKRLGYDY